MMQPHAALAIHRRQNAIARRRGDRHDCLRMRFEIAHLGPWLADSREAESGNVAELAAVVAIQQRALLAGTQRLAVQLDGRGSRIDRLDVADAQPFRQFAGLGTDHEPLFAEQHAKRGDAVQRGTQMILEPRCRRITEVPEMQRAVVRTHHEQTGMQRHEWNGRLAHFDRRFQRLWPERHALRIEKCIAQRTVLEYRRERRVAVGIAIACDAQDGGAGGVEDGDGVPGEARRRTALFADP